MFPKGREFISRYHLRL